MSFAASRVGSSGCSNPSRLGQPRRGRSMSLRSASSASSCRRQSERLSVAACSSTPSRASWLRSSISWGSRFAPSERSSSRWSTGCAPIPRSAVRDLTASVERVTVGQAVETTGLHKSYGDVEALRGIDLHVERGSVFGLLGPNGAGKTTAVRILTTLLRPDDGSARVAGFDVVRDAGRVRERIGLAGQYAAVDENLTGFENPEMGGRLYHLGRRQSRERARELLSDFVAERRGTIAKAVRRLDDAGIAIDDISVSTPTLDDVSLNLTGHAADPEAEDAEVQPR